MFLADTAKPTDEVAALRGELNGVYNALRILGISLQPQQKKAAV
jgi:hypothetical protein